MSVYRNLPYHPCIIDAPALSTTLQQLLRSHASVWWAAGPCSSQKSDASVENHKRYYYRGNSLSGTGLMMMQLASTSSAINMAWLTCSSVVSRSPVLNPEGGWGNAANGVARPGKPLGLQESSVARIPHMYPQVPDCLWWTWWGCLGQMVHCGSLQARTILEHSVFGTVVESQPQR